MIGWLVGVILEAEIEHLHPKKAGWCTKDMVVFWPMLAWARYYEIKRIMNFVFALFCLFQTKHRTCGFCWPQTVSACLFWMQTFAFHRLCCHQKFNRNSESHGPLLSFPTSRQTFRTRSHESTSNIPIPILSNRAVRWLDHARGRQKRRPR